MKNLYLFLAFILLISACKENSTNAVNNSDILNIEIKVYAWDEAGNKWSDTAVSVFNMKTNLSFSYDKYFAYSECYGKNLKQQGKFLEIGCPLEVTNKNNPNLKIIYNYDQNHYLTEELNMNGNECTSKIEYSNENGRLTRIKENSSYMTSNSRFEYDASGYISKIYNMDPNDVVTSTSVLVHNSEGYLTKQYSLTSGDTTFYRYNSQGQLIEEDYGFGLKFTYTYNASGQLVEIKESSTQFVTTEYTTYSYDNSGQVTESVRGKESFGLKVPEFKHVYSYSK
jgi:YD repeat-containing protein